MRALTAAELLALWERGGAMSAPRRALAILGSAFPDTPAETLGRLPIGRRDDLLLQLRALAFGPHLDATTQCPHCRAQLELAFTTDQLRSSANPASVEPLSLDVAEHTLRLRLPDTFDLLELDLMTDVATAESTLLRRCVLSARCGERVLAPEELQELPQPVLTAAAARLGEADPQADLRFALACPDCNHRWDEPFDIVSFFWREIEAWAVRLLGDVHTIASAYGWSEAEIVNLSPARRRIYLELVSS